jgi:hypothetical protein
MKYMMIAIAFAGATVTASAFAQSNASTTQPVSATQEVTSNATSAVAQAGQGVSPYGQPIAGKTRAQVYHELVQAEQDGQLDYLNSTVYAH